MEHAGQGASGVIHFSCLHCRVSLTVDNSLAGVTGPCPSCGESITAPKANRPDQAELRSRNVEHRDSVAPSAYGRNVQISRDPVRGERRSVGQRAGGRVITPKTGGSEAYREQAEVAAVAKMLVAGLIVLAIVLAVAFWLNSRLG